MSGFHQTSKDALAIDSPVQVLLMGEPTAFHHQSLETLQRAVH